MRCLHSWIFIRGVLQLAFAADVPTEFIAGSILQPVPVLTLNRSMSTNPVLDNDEGIAVSNLSSSVSDASTTDPLTILPINTNTTVLNNTEVKLSIRAPLQKDGPFSYLKAMAKFNAVFTLVEAQTLNIDASIKALVQSTTLATQQTSNSLGFAASTGSSDDSQWLTEAQIGTPPQTLLLNFDTGSADLWVFSTDLPVAARQKQVLYNPASSSTALAAPSSTWNITYADSSGASGFVGVDTLTLGGMSIKNQAIERSTYVSKDFFTSSMASGLLGLAFPSINTVKPNPVVTPMENMMRQGLVQNPIFTVTLRDTDTNATGQGGHFTFGYLDASSYKGQITYATVNTSQGFWQINSPYFKIGRNGNPLPRNPQSSSASGISGRSASVATEQTSSNLVVSDQGNLSVSNAARVATEMLSLGNTTSRLASLAGGLQQLAVPDHPVIIDTGTTLMLIDDATLLTIYSQIPGASFNQSVGGYTLPCSTTSPDTFYMIGEQFYGIPGRSLPFAPLDNGICFGGIQSRGSFPMDIYGDTFIKNNYLVFDQGNPPRVGVAYRPDIQFSP